MNSHATAVTRYGPLALAVLTTFWNPAAAPANAGEPGTTNSQRIRAAVARSEVQNRVSFKLKKALADGEVPTGFLGAWPVECSSSWRSNSPGLLTKETSYAPGATEPQTYVTWQYDRHGNIIVHEIRDVSSATDWHRTHCAYEDRGVLQNGKLVRKTATSGRHGDWPVYSATYNARGQHELEAEESDFDADGNTDAVSYIKYTYNAMGLLVEQALEQDDEANGTIDFRYVARATYHSPQRLQQLVQGYYAYPGAPFTTYSTLSVTVDDALKTAIGTEHIDEDGDGTSDSIVRVQEFSDDAGRVVRRIYELDSSGRPEGGADGVAEYVMEQRDEYDAEGNLVHVVFEIVDEWGLFVEEFHHTYDRQGRLIHTIFTTDILFALETVTTTYTRDQHGRVVDELRVSVFSGRSDSTRTQNGYDGFGNLVERMTSSWSGDGPPVPGPRYAYEYAEGRSGQVGSSSH